MRHTALTTDYGLFRHGGRRPQVKSSFAHFVHTLKLTAHRRGWIASPANFTPGFTPDETFEREILQHVTRTGLLEL